MASRYLLSEQSGPFIDRSAAHLNIAIVCATYYGFTCFNQELPEERAVELVLHGDLRLLEYVHSSWIKHVLEAYKSSPQDCPQLKFLSELLCRDEFKRHVTQAPSQSQGGQSDPSLERLEYLPGEIRTGLCNIIKYRTEIQKLRGSNREGENPSVDPVVSFNLTFK